MTIPAIAPVGLNMLQSLSPFAAAQPTRLSFGQLLTQGIANTETKVAEADRLARAFVLNDSIPVHQVTFALEQARLSVELMLQVRSRLTEGLQQLMTMPI